MILLDTHVLLWLLAEPALIGPDARSTIASADEVCFSAVSIAEITIKRQIGRLDVADDVDRHLERAGLTPLALTPEHAAAISRFEELARHDPFDRLLLGQTVAEQGTFLTADGRLLGLGQAFIQDARR